MPKSSRSFIASALIPSSPGALPMGASLMAFSTSDLNMGGPFKLPGDGIAGLSSLKRSEIYSAHLAFMSSFSNNKSPFLLFMQPVV